MNKIYKKVCIVLGIMCMGAGWFGGKAAGNAMRIPSRYKVPESASQMAVARYKGKSRGVLRFYTKNKNGKWKKRFSCKAWFGKRGIGKKKEGDKKTPTGMYSLGQAFGIKKNPGTEMPYIKVNKNHYWCGDSYSGTYNRLIRQDKTKHRCRGEHLIDYKGVYDYGVFVEYNKKGKPNKGSAIFLHCSKNRATGGCIAIEKKYMKRLLRTLSPAAHPRILIY